MRWLTALLLTGCVAETFELDVGPPPSLWMLRFSKLTTDIHAVSPEGKRRVVATLEEPERVSSHSAGALSRTPAGALDVVVSINARDLGTTQLVHLDQRGVVRHAQEREVGELGELSNDGQLLPVCCRNGLELLRVDGSVEASFPEVVLDHPIERPERLEYAWSADNRRLAVEADVQGERSIVLLDLDGSHQRFPLGCDDGFSHYALSPDGTALAFACDEARAFQVATHAGVESVPIAGALSGIIWLPGKNTLLSHSRIDETVIEAVHTRVDGNWSERRLHEGPARRVSFDRPRWRMAVASGPAEISIVDLTTWRTEIIASPIEIGYFYWSPTGERLAVIGDGVAIMDVRGDVLHHLSMGAPLHTIWSNDGRFFAAAYEHRVFMLHESGTIATVDIDEGYMKWTPDNWLLHEQGPTAYTVPSTIEGVISAIRPDGGEIIRYDGGLLGYWAAYPKAPE